MSKTENPKRKIIFSYAARKLDTPASISKLQSDLSDLTGLVCAITYFNNMQDFSAYVAIGMFIVNRTLQCFGYEVEEETAGENEETKKTD